MGRERVDEYGTSWAFRLLPYMDAEPVFKSHAAGQAAQAPANESAMRTPVPTYYCPSRREPAADRDFTTGSGPSPMQGVAAGGDYAANAGSESVMYGADENSNPIPQIDPSVAGPIHTFSRISEKRVVDGLSSTIAVGERYIPPAPEVPPPLVQVEQGDTAFFSSDLAETIFRSSKDGFPLNRSDSSNEKFGSEHHDLSHFVMLDGHVQPIRHDIDILVFQQLTAIGDGNVVSDDLL
jgi:hypothetical protein